MYPRVKAVIPADNYRLHLTFTNGEQGIYDCSPLLDFGVFRELRNPAYFGQVQVLHGSVAWPHEQDICPDTLYEDSSRGSAQQQEKEIINSIPRQQHAAESRAPYGAHAKRFENNPE